MTLILISLCCLVAGILLLLVAVKFDFDFLEIVSTVAMCIGGTALIVALLITPMIWHNNRMKYESLVTQKETIEAMLENPETDITLISQTVVEYNQTVTIVKIQASEFFVKDYYPSDLDWGSLEPIRLNKGGD